MPDVIRRWTSLGIPAGDAIGSGNINAPGNGDPITWQAPTGSPTAIARRPGGVAGVAGAGLSSDVASELFRLDLRYGDTTTADALGQALRIRWTAPAPPSADTALALGRSASAFSCYLYWTTSGTLRFRNAAIATFTSALTGSPTFSAASSETPAITPGDTYLIDLAPIRNASSPSSSNGRFMARVRSASNPASWNSGAEWYFDSGYTANVHTDLQQYWRFGKPLAAGTFSEWVWGELGWRNITVPETSLTKTAAIANFMPDTAPTVDVADTGENYLIQAIGTPGGGGALTYSISQTAGTTTTPVPVGPGAWIVQQDTAALEYDVLVTEAGGTSATQHYVIPAAAEPPRESHILIPDGVGGWMLL